MVINKACCRIIKTDFSSDCVFYDQFHCVVTDASLQPLFTDITLTDFENLKSITENGRQKFDFKHLDDTFVLMTKTSYNMM